MHLHVMVILFTEWFSRWADAEFRSTAKTPFQQGAEVANGVEPVLTATTVVLIHYKNLWVWIKVIEGFSNKNTFMPVLIQQENFARSKKKVFDPSVKCCLRGSLSSDNQNFSIVIDCTQSASFLR